MLIINWVFYFTGAKTKLSQDVRVSKYFDFSFIDYHHLPQLSENVYFYICVYWTLKKSAVLRWLVTILTQYILMIPKHLRKKMSSSRKHHLKVLYDSKWILFFNIHQWVTMTPSLSLLQSLMLSIAKGILEQEAKDREVERQRYMAETCQPLSLPSGIQALQVKDKKFTF